MNRKDYTRVTEILSPFTGYTAVPDSIMKPYQERGTRVHAACNLIVMDEDPWLIDDDIKGYVESFKQWWCPDWQLIEMNQRYYCDELKITGELDLLIEIGDLVCLVDIKTSKKPNLTWQYQLSAYQKLLSCKADKLLVVQAHENGSPATEHLYEYDFDTFKKCYDLYHIFFSNRRKVYEEGE